MKGVALLVTLMVAVSRVMGTVTISLVPSADPLTADLVMVCDGDDIDAYGSRVAGVALDVTVDAGVIEDVYNYKTSGESRVGDKGYGIFPSTITFTGDYVAPCEIMDTGTPVVPATHAPDNPGGLGTSSIVLEFGALYNQAVPDAAPEATTVLCTIKFSEACTVSLATNTLRGGVVRIGGEPVEPALVPGAFEPGCCGIPGLVCCYVGPDMDEWCSVGMPESWCRATQCYGDTDGKKETLGFNWFAWVGHIDVAALVSAYRVQVGHPGENLACDFDHQKEPLGFGRYTRVGIKDVAILVQYYRIRVGNMPEDCNQ